MTTIETAKIFKSGGSKALRLPKHMIPDGVDEVRIADLGDRLIVYKSRKNLMNFFETYKNVPRPDGDFLIDRSDVVFEDKDPFA